MAPTQAQVEAYLRGLQAKDILRRGYKVQARARRLLGGDAGHPRRIDTGDLRSSVQVTPVLVGSDPAVRVGTNRRKGYWVHRGTGIFGPHHQPIRPKKAKVLRFRPSGSTSFVFARSVVGMRPNRFLADALVAAKD